MPDKTFIGVTLHGLPVRARREEFIAGKDHALEELHLKHAFERA